MGKIVVSENVSLNGAMQEPGDWMTQISDADRTAWTEVLTAEADASAALLLGRRSDPWFASRWQTRTGAWADRLNGLPKYVVSSAPEPPQWSNATVVDIDAIADLKASVDGEVVVYASLTLVRGLIERGLVDELRLLVFPLIVGSGEQLGKASLRLRHSRTIGDGLLHVSYDVD